MTEEFLTNEWKKLLSDSTYNFAVSCIIFVNLRTLNFHQYLPESQGKIQKFLGVFRTNAPSPPNKRGGVYLVFSAK